MALGDVVPLNENRRSDGASVERAGTRRSRKSPRPQPRLHGEDDLSVMRGVRQGSHQAFRTLLERYWSRLVAYALPMVGGSDQAQDVVQETFVQVWRRREAWEPRGTVSAYLYRITRNLALNRERDRKVARDAGSSPEASASGPRPPPDPYSVFQDNALRRAVEGAIDSLPERRREVFLLARFHRLSYREIADTMEISPQTVANQMSAALATLRELLADLGPRG